MRGDNQDPPTADPACKQDPLLGAILADKYQVESRLGAGGMSVVYKARHKWMKKTVAVKMLLPERLHQSTNIGRFQQEAQAAGALSHQNLMTVYDLGVTLEGVPFIVMEFVEGVGLSDIIKAEGKLAPERCLGIFLQACDALAAAHDKGIVHRDIKPSNVMIVSEKDGSELVKVVDFGIAKLLPTEGEEAMRLTQTGECLGSPLYMSPEQCLAQPQDARSDIYSMGCLMYEALTGRPPLKGNSSLEIMTKHLNEVPPGLADAVSDARLREQLEAILFKAMAKEPERRYQTMHELIVALEKVRAGAGRGLLARLRAWLEIARLKRIPQKRKSVLVVGLAAAVIFLLALAAWAISALFRSPDNPYVQTTWVRTPEPPPPRPANYDERDNMAVFMITLVVNKQGEESPDVIARRAALGRFRKQYHDWTGAVASFERALWDSNKIGAASGTDYHQMQIDLADCYYELGRFEDAERLYRAAITRLAGVLDDPYIGQALGRLGDIYLRLGDLPQAETYLRRAIRAWQSDPVHGVTIDENQESGLTVSRLAEAYRREGRLDEAKETYSKAIKVWAKLEGDGAKKNLALCYYYLARIQSLKGHEQEAAATYKKALDAAEKAFLPQDPYLANFLYSYADVLWHENHWLESLNLKAKANAIRRKR